ncbi:cell division ATP-binding protein FtsE [Amnibacterium kyonggiense]|uniref:Cell division ATP-binding protein FtsE n=1 Tax=Amnibacterium kyonggiense TaxID=595671 RepID=A0A4R7FHS0_9MICO|nr:cell division ATP-binding protein FtsE [Amnibacterium kyonggiense]TDS75894.1 cell division transport system ATP-binding protein [Amnibacterium kyonggiense]
MIRFDSVTKRYRGAPRPALDDVTLEIGAGEFVFLVGASGSGKSSLLRLMLREEKPTSGEIHVLGQRLTSISTRKVPYFRRSLGVVFQDFRLLPNKTVYENVAFTLQVIGKSRGFIQTTVPDVLETVGLAEKSSNFPNELSGGEQQRVAIARAVVNKPSVLLADEPTGNLDPRTSEGIMQVLDRINQQGTTVVMATHDVTIVDRAQKRVVELVQGKIIRDELEATYVTSSIKLPKPPVTESTPVQNGSGGVPLWARRGQQQQQPATGAQEVRPSTGAVPVQRPATGAVPMARPATGAVPVQRPATGAVPVQSAAPASAPIWVRAETGPVLLPGEHAPWRAAPVAPPVEEEHPDGRSLFFAAPVPATGAVNAHTEPGAPETEADESDLRGVARRREQLPEHLDFITGLGLRGRRGDADDEVGPSS